jgi:hypothetical protein
MDGDCHGSNPPVTNTAIENGGFTDNLPIKKDDFHIVM